jgi:hypothetical protein
MNAMVKYTLFQYTDSWWNGSNIPGKKAENMTYIAGIDNYELECRAKMVGWKGFDVVSPAADTPVGALKREAEVIGGDGTKMVGVEA